MRVIPVDTSNAALMLGAVRPKVKDRQTGEIAVDRDSGTPLVLADVMFVLDGRAEMITVTVPETGISWESVFNGQSRHGIAYRATAVNAKAAR
ncbi:hypothetical protein MTQ10_27575 [Streptomyces sp. XM83C]|jgi:hypothetical protein|uniref:Regulatory protein n=1 Tax=Streptomyces thermocoprophilus TaxID=78356 RepID=A0ABV5VMX3_9ACTN|nr:hypothetical protein [Streptomyces sp. XM83C]MCK1823251.1 hypothetical protein [Streptomyces sp. XM83C]